VVYNLLSSRTAERIENSVLNRFLLYLFHIQIQNSRDFKKYKAQYVVFGRFGSKLYIGCKNQIFLKPLVLIGLYLKLKFVRFENLLEVLMKYEILEFGGLLYI